MCLRVQMVGLMMMSILLTRNFLSFLLRTCRLLPHEQISSPNSQPHLLGFSPLYIRNQLPNRISNPAHCLKLLCICCAVIYLHHFGCWRDHGFLNLMQTSLMHKLHQIYASRSKFRVTIYPGSVDHALIVALVVIFLDGWKRAGPSYNLKHNYHGKVCDLLQD